MLLVHSVELEEIELTFKCECSSQNKVGGEEKR